MSAEPVLVDTSAWVRLLRGGVHAAPRLGEVLGNGAAVTAGPVVAELLQGARETQRVHLESSLMELPFAPLSRRDWFMAGHLAAVLRLRGTPVSLADVEIAAAARALGVPVLTADRDFLRVADVLGDLRVELLEGG